MKWIFFLLFWWNGLAAKSQICNTYYFLMSGADIEQSHFDDKGRLSLRIEYKVGEVKSIDNGSEAAVVQKAFDQKGKEISSASANIQCDGDNLYMDMRLSMPGNPVAKNGEIDVTTKKVFLPYPKNLKPGDPLSNAQFSFETDGSGILQRVDIFVRNRKAESAETVTTPAGTWNCIKISFDMEIATKTAGIRIPMRMKGNEWYAPGFGVVKTESFNKNGKLAGHSEITSIKK
jgi:hypothetical protein